MVNSESRISNSIQTLGKDPFWCPKKQRTTLSFVFWDLCRQVVSGSKDPSYLISSILLVQHQVRTPSELIPTTSQVSHLVSHFARSGGKSRFSSLWKDDKSKSTSNFSEWILFGTKFQGWCIYYWKRRYPSDPKSLLFRIPRELQQITCHSLKWAVATWLWLRNSLNQHPKLLGRH